MNENFDIENDGGDIDQYTARSTVSTFQDYDGRGSKVQHTTRGDLVMLATKGGARKLWKNIWDRKIVKMPAFPEAIRPELYRLDYITAMKVAGDTDMDMKSALLIEDAWRNEWNRGVQVPVDDCPRAKRARVDFRKVE
jgi:hypothetical protein